MFNTILVATDRSEHARKAVTLAADLAEKYGSRLVLTHVANPKQLSYETLHAAQVEHVIDGDMLRHRERQTDVIMTLGRELLNETRARVRNIDKVTTRLEEGDPAKRIIEAAKAENADLIILGSRGLGTLQGLMLGSVSHKVTQLAPCTCITVK